MSWWGSHQSHQGHGFLLCGGMHKIFSPHTCAHIRFRGLGNVSWKFWSSAMCPRGSMSSKRKRGVCISGQTFGSQFDFRFRWLEAKDLAQGAKRRASGSKSLCHSGKMVQQFSNVVQYKSGRYCRPNPEDRINRKPDDWTNYQITKWKKTKNK